MNPKEKILWLILKDGDGYKFKRQFPFGKYVLDFYSEELRLAIELDDNSREPHDHEYHLARRDFISSKGIKLITIPESFIQNEVKNLQNKILNRRREKR